MINFFPLVWLKENMKYINIDMHVLKSTALKKRSSTKLSQISIQKEHVVGMLIEYSYPLKLNTGLDPLPPD